MALERGTGKRRAIGTYLFLYFLRERFSQPHTKVLFDAREQEEDSLPFSLKAVRLAASAAASSLLGSSAQPGPPSRNNPSSGVQGGSLGTAGIQRPH